jgi:hypothetical protein
MVREARKVLRERGVPEGHVWEGNVLDPAAYGCPGEPARPFDCVVSCGVLPHVPRDAEPTFIGNLRQALAPGGLAIVEARNELFSLFTLNRYSHQLFLEQLIPVAALRARAQAAGELAGVEEALRQIGSMFRTDLPPLRRGKAAEPGYDEVLSRVHNPLTLREQFLEAGFAHAQLLYYHFHCLPPLVGALAPAVFKEVSLQMERDPHDWRGLIMASAFLLVARLA